MGDRPCDLEQVIMMMLTSWILQWGGGGALYSWIVLIFFCVKSAIGIWSR